MTELEYTTQINSLTAQKNALLADAASLISSGNDWINDANGYSCSGTKAKKAACEAEKTRKIAVGKGRITEAATKKEQAAQLQTQIDSLNLARKNEAATSNQVSLELSKQGITQEAILTKAKGESDAALKSAEITSTAQADAISKNADADAANKKKIGVVVAVIGVVVIAIVGFVLYKRFKKKK